MKFIFLPLVLLSLNLFSGDTVFEDLLDEFTDKRQISIGLVGDEHVSYSSELILIYCADGRDPIMGIQKGILIGLNSNPSITLRFDKNKPITEEFSYNSSQDILFTFDRDFMTSFLNNLRNSNNLIVKIQGKSEIMRFTDLDNSKKHVAEFINAASEMPSSCDLF
ncbi:hypothetical protein M9B40_05075 [SAR86 cluster bacterium]|jgi:hypothetical protein|uniref:Uncharacterized protein n=1 Tax=SAR86 cluster bacterium TaxID=2030880 RepID=A0A9Q8TYE1_9GAMM|nr:hypothetical protein M9B40_05075 [SAR86 cluster bacterium]